MALLATRRARRLYWREDQDLHDRHLKRLIETIGESTSKRSISPT
jgi:hypothetical protein